MKRPEDREAVLAGYARHITNCRDLRDGLPALRGKVLFDWEHPVRSHAAVLAEMVNQSKEAMVL